MAAALVECYPDSAEYSLALQANEGGTRNIGAGGGSGGGAPVATNTTGTLKNLVAGCNYGLCPDQPLQSRVFQASVM